MNRVDVEQLYREVCAEVETCGRRRHGRRATYAAGCRGPLCLKAERDHQREKNRLKREEEGFDVVPAPPRKGRIFDPYLAKWQLDHDAIQERDRDLRRSYPQRRRDVPVMATTGTPAWALEALEALRSKQETA